MLPADLNKAEYVQTSKPRAIAISKASGTSGKMPCLHPPKVEFIF